MYVTTVISKITGGLTHVNSSVGRRKENIEVRLTHALKPPSPASEKKNQKHPKTKEERKERKTERRNQSVECWSLPMLVFAM